MNSTKLALAASLIVAILSFAIGVASAGTATSVANPWAGVNFDDHSGKVPPGSTVCVYWVGVTPSDGTVDITVRDPNFNAIASWTDQPPSASGTLSFVASTPGTYFIQYDGYPSYHTVTTIVASTSILVLPESTLGTIVGLMGGFLALGVFITVKKKTA